MVSVTLLEGAKLVTEAPGQIAIETPLSAHRPRLTFKQLTPGLTAALEQLNGSGASIPYLIAKLMQSEGPAVIGKLQAYLGKLGQHALLNYSLLLDEQALLLLRPLSGYFRYQENKVTGDGKYLLSRFAYCRNHGRQWLIESPRGHADIVVQSPQAQLALYHLAQPCGVAELAAAVPELGVEGANRILDFLANAELLLNAAEADPEVDEPTLGQWDFHDLLFHSRSRLGRHANPYGGTYPFKDKFPSLPAVKPAMSNQVIPLYEPQRDGLLQQDAPFTRVLEARASIREQGESAISVEQLGEFLWRSARIKKLAPEAGVSFRPYPGGGALHELEIYPLVSRCQGLEPGLYHYNAAEHQLEKVAELTPPVQMLAQMAGVTATLDHPPQVLFIIAARFQRVQNKYQSVTYSVILKNVGGLYQTFYLVATAMGLAPCALGGGHSDLFAQATGLDYYAETSVGEFILGSRKV